MSDIKDIVWKTKPYAHQLEAFTISRDKPAFALLMEMGTGKSLCAIMTAAWLFNKGQINGALVIAPKSICRNWADKEIPTHLPEHIERLTVIWGSDSVKLNKQLELTKQVEPLKLHIFVMNIEALGTERAYNAALAFLRGHRTIMIIDESTTIKNPKAARTKWATKLGLAAAYRRILTGTPVTQSPLDVFAQFEFLEHGCLGSSTYYGFRNQYAVLRKRYVNGRSFDEVVGYQRLRELQAAVGSLSYRVLKRDCLDLPEKVYEVRHVELTPKQALYYEQMKEEALAVIGDTAVAAPLVLTQLLRLRQALCNLAPTEGGAQFIDEKNPRVDAVLELLEEAGSQKVLIWANFVPVIQLLTATIGKAYGEETVRCIMGAVGQEERQEAVNCFQDEKSPVRFLVMQPRTGGLGLTLTAATLVIYHDNDWSLEVRQQSEDRAHRIGQKNAVTYVDLIAPGTVDEKIREALLEKRDLADRVTGDSLRKLLT